MNFMKDLWNMVCLVGMLFFVGACSNGGAEEPGDIGVSGRAGAGDIFHSRRELSYGDSLQVRVLSWGGEKTGSYLVLLADSLNQHYIGDSFFRQGTLANAWVADLDEDGLPEVGVVLKEAGDLQYGRLSLHELSNDFSLQTRTFPPLPEALGAAYGGNDSIYMQDDKTIVREFRLLDRLDTLSQNSKSRRVLYVFENNQLHLSDSEEINSPEE